MFAAKKLEDGTNCIQAASFVQIEMNTEVSAKREISLA